MPYADLEVFVQALPGSGYAIDLRFRRADGTTDSELASNISIQIDLPALQALLHDPAAYGRALTQMIFGDSRLHNAWVRVRGFADGAGVPLRIRLRIDAAATELHSLRWETLYDLERDAPIVANANFLCSRYLDSGDMSALQLPLRRDALALLVVASPSDLAAYGLTPFDGPAEAERIRQALAPVPAASLVSGPDAPAVTLAAVVDALHYGYSILYLVCHGVLRDGTPYLFLENEQGAVQRVSGDELVQQIANLPAQVRPALIVFASCQSVGVGHGSDVPAAIGPQLARAGVGAVIGMQGNLPMATAARLMPRFCTELIEHGEVDRALAVARASLDAQAPWWMPVLFLRLRNGKIWREAAPVTPKLPSAQRAPAARGSRTLLLWAGGSGMLVLLLLLGVLFVRQPRAEPSAMPASPTSSAPIALIDGPPAVPSSATPLPEPTSAPTPEIAPVPAGRTLVLLADLEPATGGGRDYTRDLFDDLVANLETVGFSNIAVRRYPRVLTSADEARRVAAERGAAVILWGRNVSSGADLYVQRGDWLARYAAIPPQLSAEVLDASSNLRLQLRATNEQLPTAAFGVLAALNVLGSAAGDNFAVLRVATLQDRLQENAAATAIGISSGARIYAFVTNYYTATEEALASLTLGISDAPDNPLLHLYRGTVYQRLNELQLAGDDARTALELVPGWSAAHGLQAVVAAQQGDLRLAHQALSAIVTAQPDDWFAWGYRGAANYLLDDLAAARSDAERSIALGPGTAQPYSVLVMVALREGRTDIARQQALAARERFRGQRGFDSTLYAGTFGGDNLVGVTTTAFDRLLARQYGDVAEIAERGLEMAQAANLAPARLADYYMLRGLALCNSGDAAAALTDYTAAITRSPEFGLLYLLRADVQLRLGDLPGALADLEAAAASPQGEQLAAVIAAARSGEVNCRNILE